MPQKCSSTGGSATRPYLRWMAALALILIVCVWFILQGCRSADDSLADLKSRGELRVCMDASYPPFEWIPEGAPPDQIVGLDVELARAIAARLGVGATLVNVGWDGLYDSLLVGKCDAIISALPYDPTRTEEAVFSISYFNAGPVLLVRADETAIVAPEDLADRTLAVTWGSAGDVEASALSRRLRGLEVLRLPDPAEVLAAVRAGEADAALVDHLTALEAVHADEGFAIVGEPLTDDLYAIAVRHDDAALLAAVDEALVALRDDGTLERLKKEWFSRSGMP